MRKIALRRRVRELEATQGSMIRALEKMTEILQQLAEK